jgi:hypothetical protein
MKTKDTLTLLRQVEAALQFYANHKNYESRTVDAGCGCHSDVIGSVIDETENETALQALPAIDELLRMSAWMPTKSAPYNQLLILTFNFRDVYTGALSSDDGLWHNGNYEVPAPRGWMHLPLPNAVCTQPDEGNTDTFVGVLTGTVWKKQPDEGKL